MKPDFTIPKKIIDKLELNKEYEFRGFWDGNKIQWQWKEKEDKK